MMNLRHVEVFHAVYQTGSVSDAARALHVSQPSISKILRHAEARIGIQLFRLLRGRLVPTEEAHILFHQARELHSQIETLRETTQNLKRSADGFLRLAVLPSLGLDLAPAAVAQFREKKPDVSFEIKTIHNDNILRSLQERSSDLAVAYDAPRHPKLASILIGTGEPVVLFRKDDLKDVPTRLSLAMLKHKNLIRLTGTGSVGALFSSQVVKDQPEEPGVSVQTYYVAAALVRRGAGIAIVDEFTARVNRSADLDFRPLEACARFGVYCVHLEDRPPSGIALEFVTTLKNTLEELQAQ